MPIYEYECGTCGGRFEATMKFSDPELTECRLCNAANIRKVLSAPAFVLKGSGWYVTDYPSADRKKASEADKSQTSSSKSENASSSGCASGACAGGSCASKTAC